MKYTLQKQPDGKWRASLELPAGDGTLTGVAQGLSKAEATIAAARLVSKHPQAPKNKSAAIQAIASAAKNPAVRQALIDGGLKAAETAAAAIPGGAAVVSALKLAAKYGPAKRLLQRLL